MRKILSIATISFMLAGCSKGLPVAPKMSFISERPAGNISYSESGTSKTVYTFQVGPFDLKANGTNGGIPTAESKLNFNVEDYIWMTSFVPSIEDAEGNALPSKLVHQIMLINRAEKNDSCTGKQAGNPFAAATTNLKEIELPEGHGYLISPDDPLEANVILKNKSKNDYYNIYVKFTISGEPISDAKLIKDVSPVMIDIDPCDHKPVSIAPRQFVEKIAAAYSPTSGSLVKAYGLLQDYGVYASIKINDEEEPFWQGVAEINENYEIVGMEPFEDPTGVPLNKGDKLNLAVAYDNVSDEWFDEASGAAIVYLARGEEEEETSPTGESNDLSATNAQTELLK